MSGQREKMRELVAKYGMDKEKVCLAYARAERNGEVTRKRNEHDISPEDYADRLWRDGLRKSNPWLKKPKT
jgi:hypothetical protein